ncbi:PepSY domain-containing protein [Gulosibacter sp. 10]|uniref:PepSY domain-containing protein n=1 Tax=Gulosibacter sp. 10 TaxID=1255570 RepID=UPI00097E91B3|nr:PepSY domain-containing protein [Gulosibacter sp. 10]SJM55171.1 hypothetical protein FM112_03905 [Gulosibacter sp. 10]
MNKKLQNLALSSVAVPALLVSLAACSNGDQGDPAASQDAPAADAPQDGGGFQNSTEDAAPTEDGATGESADGAGSGGDSAEYATAIAAAEEAVGADGVAFSLDRDDDDDALFNIDVAQGTTVYEIDVTASGEARIDEAEEDDLDGDDQRELEAAQLTILEAIDAALAHQPGVLEEVDLDTENGVVVWNVDYEDRGLDDLNVDAATGEVTVDNDD